MLCWRPPARLHRQLLAMFFTSAEETKREESKPQEVLQNLQPWWQLQEAMGKEKGWEGRWRVTDAGQKQTLRLQWVLRGAKAGQRWQLLRQHPGTRCAVGCCGLEMLAVPKAAWAARGVVGHPSTPPWCGCPCPLLWVSPALPDFELLAEAKPQNGPNS